MIGDETSQADATCVNENHTVQNNSITDSTIQALAAQIEQNRPELIRSLTEVGKYAGLISSYTVCTMSRLEDVVTKTHRVLG